MKRIILTGGGTAGHVAPNIALIPRLQELDYEIHYIGSIEGIERKMIEKLGIPYYPIQTGKLRRYFDMKNLSDPFRGMKGGRQARGIIRKLRPNIIFSIMTAHAPLQQAQLLQPALLPSGILSAAFCSSVSPTCAGI